MLDFGLALKGLSTISVHNNKFSDYELDDYPSQPFSIKHDAQVALTKYKENNEEIKKLREMAKSINNTIAIINKMFACFGFDYINTWDDKRRRIADEYRRAYNVEYPFCLVERNYIISVIKRRIEVVMEGKEMPYEMCQDSIDREIELLKCYRYHKN